MKDTDIDISKPAPHKKSVSMPAWFGFLCVVVILEFVLLCSRRGRGRLIMRELHLSYYWLQTLMASSAR